MGEGENPLAGFTPCQSRPCFKASWIQERGGGKKNPYEQKQGGEKEYPLLLGWVENNMM